MTTLRQRIPFNYPSDSNHSEELLILDDQEQDELIDQLRIQNSTSDQQHKLALQVLIALSSVLHLIYLFSNQDSPLFAVFPPGPEGKGFPLPLSRLVAFMDIFFHVNLCLLVHPYRVTDHASRIAIPLSYTITFAWSAIPFIFSILGGRVWQVTMWWSLMAIITSMSYTIQTWIEEANDNLSKFERMKYKAAGA
ncbi:hypothetical protein BJ138DRAFT_1128726 [Hygrophoropsis aurantiaca]|uniref:Uncharacterized protein n=1 Tax=Hygrophoropsis aurantiaca TaxID=72124 RepID=A0ACB8A4P8_9AGAM|nr:hypothetical protein BJ138DRAFT_1128726 [Hygrophoropsis aurantiaca]